MKPEVKPCEKCPVPCKEKVYNPYNEDCEVWHNPTPYISEWQKTIEMMQDEKEINEHP